MPLGDILGNSAFGASNDIVVIEAIVNITGLELTMSLGDVTLECDANVAITGLTMVMSIGNVSGWVDIPTSQTPNWTVVNTR